MEKFWFDKPTQVWFKQDDEIMETDRTYRYYGIGYRDEIICGCCGHVFRPFDVISYGELMWVDLTEEIKGDLVDE